MTLGLKIPIGTIVTLEAPGSRGEEEGSVRIIPAIVMKQWDDGSVQLFAFHFEGSFLMNTVPINSVTPVSPVNFASDKPLDLQSLRPQKSLVEKFSIRDNP
jgi:hypothetical protein